MAEIKPFRGLLYDKNRIDNDCSGVMAPPYDVISDKMREELYEKSPYNIIRLILGKPLENDNDTDNKYTRARKSMDEWQEEGVITRDGAEAFYAYQQEYEFKGVKHTRTGFLGLMKIGEPGNDDVIPHEHTLAKPKEDRMNLIKQVKGNLSPIFTLFDDKSQVVSGITEEVISGSDPIIDIELEDGKHKIWRITGENGINEIVSELKGKKVFIADGHHRYEVSRMYRNLCREEDGYDGRADYVMMYFADMSTTDNLTVMATHRVVKDMSCREENEIAEKLGVYFDVTAYDDLKSLVDEMESKEDEGQIFGYYVGGKYFLIVPKDREVLLGLIKEDRAEEWKQLDVSVLHSVVFNGLLSVSGEEGNITYVKTPEEAEALVTEGSHQAAFLLNPTKVSQLRAVAERAEMMPQKSTYFYPKLLTGLVINKFEGAKVGVEEKNGS